MASSTNSIKKLAIRGAVWTIAGYGASQVLRFGSNLLLTRLLFPDLFGLMSLVYVFISGLLLFSDLGISTSVVQNKRGDDPTFLNTAWTLQVIRGSILWLLCLVLAIPIAKLYNEPQLALLMPVVGLSSVLAGFNSTAIFTLNRHLSVKQVAMFEFGGQLVSVVIMLIWAVISPSVWALVAGGLAAPLFQLIWSHRMNTGKPNWFAWDKSAVSEIISFGKWIFLSTALTFLATQSDRLILGKIFTFEMLGVYGVAFTLSDIPRQLMLAISSKVIFPTYAKMMELPRSEFRTKILRNRRLILLVLAAVVAGLAGLGDLVVTTLYDERYHAAAWMLPLLAMGTWPIMLTQTIDPVLFAIGQPRYIAFGCFLSFFFYIVGIPVAFSLYGSMGAVISIALSNIPPWATVAYALWREKISVLRQDAVMTLIFLAIMGLIFLFRSLMGFQSPLLGAM